MRKGRGLLFVLVGIALAALAGLMVLQMGRQAEEVAKRQAAPAQPVVNKVYVVVADKDIPENVAVSAKDLATKEFPADFAPAGAISAPEYAVGKYTTSRIYKGQILVSPLLAETRKAGQFSARVPEGKVAMAVTVNDAMNSLGALRAGDKVDILLTLDLKKGLSEKGNTTAAQQSQQAQPAPAKPSTPREELPTELLSTQLTIQNAEILNIGLPAGDTPTTGQTGQQNQQQTQASQQASKTITFLLDHQDSVTLKFIKDSGGTMDLIVRAPDDKRLVKTEAVTLDTIYQQFRFRFPEPLK